MANQKHKDHAWDNAKKITGQNPDVWRKDAHGNVIRKSSYGTSGEYAWEVDHKFPVAKGGTDHLRNIQALHKSANRTKSDNYPHNPKKK